MTADLPRAAGPPGASAVFRSCPGDFVVCEQLGFEPSGEGEHVFLHLQKRNLNTMDLVQRVSELSGIPPRDIGLSGLKDRRALTRQWLSVRMAGKPEPDWQALAVGGDVQVLAVGRHLRKLKRGVHRANRFTLVLRELGGDCSAMEQRLQQIRQEGFPNYFGEQRFGRDGATLQQARRWMASGGRRISRNKRGLFLSALRAHLFNTLLAQRVETGEWNRILPGDVCMLQGSRSLFTCDEVDGDIIRRAICGDIHPGLPLWGKGESGAGDERVRQQAGVLADEAEVCDFLERAGLDLAWRAARTLADDFSWKFCDDGSLQLDFALGAGSYATALLAEFVQYKENREW